MKEKNKEWQKELRKLHWVEMGGKVYINHTEVEDFIDSLLQDQHERFENELKDNTREVAREIVEYLDKKEVGNRIDESYDNGAYNENREVHRYVRRKYLHINKDKKGKE